VALGGKRPRSPVLPRNGTGGSQENVSWGNPGLQPHTAAAAPETEVDRR